MCLCVAREEDWRRSMVVVGARSLDEGARYMAIKHFIKHPQYRSFHRGNQNNIALIQLKKKLKPEHVTPVTLPNANEVFDESSECWVTGWGKVGRNGKFCTESRCPKISF